MEEQNGHGQLARLPPQIELEVQPLEDDWSGITNQARRRKIQNRLNQRKYRKRRAATAQRPADAGIEVAAVPPPIWANAVSTDRRRENIEPALYPQASSSTNCSSPESLSVAGGRSGSLSASESSSQRSPIAKKRECLHTLTPLELQAKARAIEASACKAYAIGSPRLDLLLTLIQLNVFRALISNTSALGFTMDWLCGDAISPWSQGVYANSSNPTCPTSLRPTFLQQKVSHHPWIDLFPFPRMRDNLLIAGESYDEDALCNDLVEFCDVPHEQTGLIVWKEPWDPSGWEASEAFLRKWRWVVEGCFELLQSTNYWRTRRGEKLLSF